MASFVFSPTVRYNPQDWADPVEKPSLVGDIKRAYGQGVSSVGSTLQDLGFDQFGRRVEDYGTDIAERYPSEIQSFSDVLDKPLTTVREATGELVPQAGAVIGGTLAGRAIGTGIGALTGPLAPVAMPLLGTVGGFVGGLVPITAQTYGGIRQEQREQGIDDKGRALLATAPAVALERLGVEKLAGGLASKGIRGIAREAADEGQSFLGYVGRQAVKGGITEGPLTEVPQTALERFGAYKDTLSQEAFDEYGVAGAKGFAGGAVFSGGIAAVRPRGADLLQGKPVQDTETETTVAPLGEDRQLGLFSEQEAPIELAPPSQIINPYNVGGFVGAQSEGLDTTMRFAGQGGQQELLAAGPEQTIEEAPPPSQTAKAEPVTEEEYSAVATKYGLTPVEGATNRFDIAGRRFYSKESLDKFVSDLAVLERGKSDFKKALDQIVLGRGDVKVTNNTSAASLNKLVEGKLNKLQIKDAVSAEEAADILNDQISRLGDAGKQVTDKAVSELAAYYEAITGQTAPAYERIENQRKQAKNVVAPSTTPTTTTTAAPTAASQTMGLVTTQAQGEKSARADAKASGPVTITTFPEGQRPLDTGTTVQPTTTEQPGQVTGATEQQQQQQSAEIEAARQAWEDMDVSGVDYNLLTEQDKQAWAQAVAEGKATGEAQEELANEYTVAAEQELAQQILERTMLKIVPKSPNKAQFFADYLGSKKEVSNEELAGRYKNVSLETIKDWTNQLNKLLEDPAKLVQAFTATAVEMRLNPSELQLTLQGISAKAKQQSEQLREATQPDEVVLDERDVGDPESGLAESDRKSASLQEVNKAEETRNAKYIRLNKEITKAEEEGDTDLVTELTEQLDALIEQMNKQAAKVVRASKEKEPKRAVQKRQTKKVSVQPKTEAGQGVGQEVRGAEKPAGEGKTEEAKVGQTTEEQAAAAWNKGISAFPDAPKFADLTQEQQETFIEFGPDNWTESDVQNELIKLAKSGVKFSKKTPASSGSKVKDIKKTILKFFGAENERVVGVYQSVNDIPEDIRAAVEEDSGGPITADTQGFVYRRRAYLIADNIVPGTERAVLMHEVGSHLGLENILTEEQFDVLVDKILSWSEKADGSIESAVALKAMARVVKADPSVETRNAELVAYFIEEAILAGVNPTAASTQKGFGSWFRTLWAAFKSAVRKLGMNPDEMDAIDIVNMAYGAGRLEVAGTWHGTAAAFRKFDHNFMGKGEGAQAYGWGTYLAQRSGIAYDYMVQDVSRKNRYKAYQTVMYDGRPAKEIKEELNKKRDEYYDLTDDEISFKLAFIEILNAIEERGPNPLKVASVSLAGKAANKRLYGADMYKKASDWLDKNYSKFELVRTEEQKGRMLRVDVNAKPDELLDWNKSLMDQPKIRKKLLASKKFQIIIEAIENGLAPAFPTMLDAFNSEGEYFYRGIEEMFATNLPQTTENGNSPDRYLSLILDSAGVRGIKFYDASSRTKPKSFYRSQIEHVKLMAEAAKETAALGPVDSEKYSPEKVKEKIARLEEKLANAPEDYLLTQNLVIFNDKNIFRAATFVEGDQEQVKFSKKAQANLNKLPLSVRPQNELVINTLEVLRKAVPTFAFTSDLSDIAQKKMKSVKKFFDLQAKQAVTTTELELAVRRILDAYDKLPAEVKGTGPNSVNKFIKDSTMSGKWGYKIKDDSNVVPDPDLEVRFKKFPPEAQAVIKSVFKHGYDTLQTMKKAVRENITTQYDALIVEAQKANDDKEVARLQKDKDAALKDYANLLAIANNKPYAPLKRFGNYVVVGKSTRLLDAEKQNDRAEIRRLKQDPAHYYVAFAETKGEGQTIANAISGSYDSVSDVFEKAADETLYGGSDMNQVFARIRNLVEESSDANTSAATVNSLRRLVNNLHTQMLGQQSAMHATNRRLGVAGADDDMMRSFATQGRATAHFIGAVSNTEKVYEALRAMKTEAGQDAEARMYYNEFVRRHAMGYDYDPSPVLNKALATTSFMMLLTSPAYYLQNLTQPFMLSVPYMAGVHGYARTNAEMAKAYPDTFALLKNISLGQELDYSKLPEDVRSAIEDMVSRGIIDISLEQDLGRWESSSDKTIENLGKVTNKLQSIAQKAEMVNRIATAIAAYRLARSGNRSEGDARDYAAKVIRTTHGDYSGANAPRFMRKGVGRLVTQFRKFQLIQISMMARLFNDAFRNSNSAERYAAKKALLFVFAHAGAVGGIIGLPGFQLAAAIWGALFGDDDEPFDAERQLREFFGDDIGVLMTRGVPADFGIDLSGKLGMGQMLSILPYADIDLSKAGWEKTVTAAMGPFIGGLVPRAIGGIEQIQNGNYYKGVEQLMPKGLTDAMKAYRISTEGVTQTNNDVALSPDEFSTLQIFGAALGLPIGKLTERQFDVGSKIEAEKFFDKRTTELKRKYAKAYRDNDKNGMNEARESWKSLQDSRVAMGFSRQPLSNLLRSPREQRERERNTRGGVQFTRETRGFVADITEEEDE